MYLNLSPLIKKEHFTLLISCKIGVGKLKVVNIFSVVGTEIGR